MVDVLRSVPEVQAWRASLAPKRRVALVPTMGFLHEGHLSLVREARRRVSDGTVAVSIFVNPTQFGPREDLATYPRDEAGDLKKAADAGADLAFCPGEADTMYPSRQTWVDVEGLSARLCGASRPGHFRGVCTVVAKLFILFRPDVTVFGEKDYQQLAIIRRMHADLFLSGEVLGMPIIRESDGLAMSSRNANLTADARGNALRIPRYLDEVRARFAAGERNAQALLGGPADALSPGDIDYVELVDAADLQSVTTVERPALCALAVRFGGVRLIDNTVLRP